MLLATRVVLDCRQRSASYSHGLQLKGPALQSKGPVPPAEGTF
jgi:hypothetical protein